MKNKDQILLEQAYQRIQEDAQDAPQDAALEKSIKEILLGAIRREELNEYSLERGSIVPEIMQAIQHHVKQQLRDAEAKGYDFGIQAARDMDEFYAQEGVKRPKVDPRGQSIEPTKRDFDQEWKDAAATRKEPTGPEPKITRGPGAGIYKRSKYQ